MLQGLDGCPGLVPQRHPRSPTPDGQFLAVGRPCPGPLCRPFARTRCQHEFREGVPRRCGRRGYRNQLPKPVAERPIRASCPDPSRAMACPRVWARSRGSGCAAPAGLVVGISANDRHQASGRGGRAGQACAPGPPHCLANHPPAASDKCRVLFQLPGHLVADQALRNGPGRRRCPIVDLQFG